MLAGAGAGSRLTGTPPIVTVSAGLIVNVPAVVLLIVTVYVATLPTTETGVTAPTVPGADGLKLTVGVPNDTGEAPAGDPVTVMVKVCAWPTSLVALGAMAMLAST